MAVIVKDLDMPSCCYECRFNFESDWCSAGDLYFNAFEGFDKDVQRLPECPLAPFHKEE